MQASYKGGELKEGGYASAQTLVQDTAYTLSDKIFSYSPDFFALDKSVLQWSLDDRKNAYGRSGSVIEMQTRSGAASLLLGYVFGYGPEYAARTFRPGVPQTVLASPATLLAMQPALTQLGMVYRLSSPLVAHVAAVEYSAEADALITDYASTLQVAQECGLAVIASRSSIEVQHMSLFSTLAASIRPTVHTYDGVRLAHQISQVKDFVDAKILHSTYQILKKVPNDTKLDASENLARLLSAFNKEVGTTYRLFEYEGDRQAEVVVVVFGSMESSVGLQTAKHLAKSGEKVGVISVRVVAPFSEQAFLHALPTSSRLVGVIGQVALKTDVDDPSTHSSLFTSVLATVILNRVKLQVIDLKYSPEQSFSPRDFAFVFSQLQERGMVASLTSGADIKPIELLAEDGKQLVFWDLDDSDAAACDEDISGLLSLDTTRQVTLSSKYNHSVQTGIKQSQIRLIHQNAVANYDIEDANLVVIAESKILHSYDTVDQLRHGGRVLLNTSLALEDIEKLPSHFKKGLAVKNAELFIINAQQSDARLDIAAAALYLSDLQEISDNGEMDAEHKRLLEKSRQVADSKLVTRIDTPTAWLDIEALEKLPTALRSTGFERNLEKSLEELFPTVLEHTDAAKFLSFKEAYQLENTLRPDMPTQTYKVKVQENRRLTPMSYNRNIFHIEFDIKGSGLNYDIGEALGIHGHNDATLVYDFIDFYELDPEDLIEVPAREDASKREIRTVFQALSQNLDIFGRPPKKFYEALAAYATDANESKELLRLAGSEGLAEFKRRANVETITYADLLIEFTSARPPFRDLATTVSPLKRREYSIASCQKVHPNSVHLLIVVVDWKDPRGRDRYGHCSRYLSQLEIGTEVIVSIKPSVMKLPELATSPIIMAGLGTGLAPFRAFVEYRAWQRSQGEKIGPVLLYMGSRHQREEYLYGEEWEAYRDAGIITLLGQAFSRDQPQKIYIQNRMTETLSDVVDAFITKHGSFYLCGPTWPVPDVTQVLEDAIATEAKQRQVKVDTAREIESIKDNGRYVLEVY